MKSGYLPGLGIWPKHPARSTKIRITVKSGYLPGFRDLGLCTFPGLMTYRKAPSTIIPGTYCGAIRASSQAFLMFGVLFDVALRLFRCELRYQYVFITAAQPLLPTKQIAIIQQSAEWHPRPSITSRHKAGQQPGQQPGAQKTPDQASTTGYRVVVPSHTRGESKRQRPRPARISQQAVACAQQYPCREKDLRLPLTGASRGR
jgi:hypothetical protein